MLQKLFTINSYGCRINCCIDYSILDAINESFTNDLAGCDAVNT